MTDRSIIQARFDSWVESGDPASLDTFFLYHHWVEHMDVPVIAHRANGEIVFVNEATARLFRRRRRDALGKPVSALLGDAWFVSHAALVDAASDGHTTFQTNLRFDGELDAHFQIMTTVVRNSAGDAGIIWLVMRDVTKIVRAEEELREVNKRLRESNRDLEDFAYVASHDLQEPLRKISAFGDRLRRNLGDDVDEKSLDYLDRMDNASRRMQILITDLLSFSRVSTKGSALVPIDLREVVARVVGDLEVAISDADAVVHIGSLPVIDADGTQMGQLVQNLLGNALKFSDPGRAPEIWIEAAMVGGRWLLSVRDNGIGFDQTYADKIFTVFQRLHGRSQYEGTGVGLAICRKIVERHGGTIRAMGVQNEGATFVIDLPRSRGELVAAA